MRALLPMVLLLLAASCRLEGSGNTEAGAFPEARAVDAGEVVYSWVDEHGQIRMASRSEDIPEQTRDHVVVTDTAASRAERLRRDRLLVLDLRQQKDGGPANYTVVDLASLQRPRNPAEGPLSPGAFGQRTVDRAAGAVREWLGLLPQRREAGVILYMTSWCGFCKKASVHLRSRGVAFEERDIEADRQAAVELDRKLRQAGLSDSGVPVLDIGGILVIGFDQGRIDELLAKQGR